MWICVDALCEFMSECADLCRWLCGCMCGFARVVLVVNIDR